MEHEFDRTPILKLVLKLGIPAMCAQFFNILLYIICVFLFPVFYPLENVFYAETVSDIVGACITLIAFMTVIIPKLRLKMNSKTS